MDNDPVKYFSDKILILNKTLMNIVQKYNKEIHGFSEDI